MEKSKSRPHRNSKKLSQQSHYTDGKKHDSQVDQTEYSEKPDGLSVVTESKMEN